MVQISILYIRKAAGNEKNKKKRFLIHRIGIKNFRNVEMVLVWSQAFILALGFWF